MIKDSQRFAEKIHLDSLLEAYTGSHLQRVKDAKETACYKWVVIVTKLFNTAASYFDAKKSTHCSRVLVVSELFVSRDQCT